jgi:CubicO group peptidase (beta-lactamase class C family)
MYHSSMPALFERPRQILLDAVDRRVTPCAVAEVGHARGPIWRQAAGTLSYGESAPAATAATIFDLASLTKVVATTSLAMRLVERGRLHLQDPVRQHLPRWNRRDRASVTIGDLLEHASGLPALLPLYENGHGRPAFEEAVCDAALAYTPRTQSVYSDLGFMLLGFILADVGGAPLDAQFEGLAHELELARGSDVLRFGPLDGDARVAPTQVDDWRGRLLRGEVDDRNGAALGGVAGHTGLFGTVAAVGRFAQGMLAAARSESSQATAPASADTVRRFLSGSTVPGSSRALGWDRMRPTSSCGTRMSADAFGHTGFTGTSMWMDPRADVYAVLLTNRVHPVATAADGIQALRRAFHDAVLDGLGLRA